jgi:hypothetical protein
MILFVVTGNITAIIDRARQMAASALEEYMVNIRAMLIVGAYVSIVK